MTTKPINTSAFKHTFKSDDKTAPDATSTDIIVLKIGSSSITAPDGRILVSNLGRFVEFAHELRIKGYKPVIVSSGAVSVGVNKLKLAERPKDVITKQAVAAVGQNALMTIYDNLFSALGITTAQVLLTRDNINSSGHYLNATNTLEQLLAMDIVPIVNENDTIAVQELKIGDNDSLSAMVSCMLNAKHLFLATDVTSLYTADPKSDPTATPLHLIEDINETVKKFSKPEPDGAPATSGRWGTGGMATKVTAANLCMACGVDSSIISSASLDHVWSILQGTYNVGTTFKAYPAPFLTGRKKFLWVGMSPIGEIYVDHDCAALFTGDLSRSYHLLSAGVLWCSGTFERGSCVNIIVADHKYLKRLVGKSSYVSPSQLHSNRIKKSTAVAGNSPASASGVLGALSDGGVTGDESTGEGELSPKIHPTMSKNGMVDFKLTPEGGYSIPNGTIIGRGSVNFASEDLMKIRGVKTKDIDDVLGFHPRHHHVIDSDNLAIHYRTSPHQQQQPLATVEDVNDKEGAQ